MHPSGISAVACWDKEENVDNTYRYQITQTLIAPEETLQRFALEVSYQKRQTIGILNL